MAIIASEHDSVGALAIIREWDWERYDHDFCEGVPRWRTLSEAMNALAMSGHADPPGVLLHLLSTGRLIATGHYHWQASRNGHEYSKAEHGRIRQEWWQMFRDGLAARDWRTGNTVCLSLLDIKDVSRAEWAWQRNTFAVAKVDGDEWLDDDYAEERVVVLDIEVHCPPAGNDNCDAPALAAPAVEQNKGGAPRQYDWDRAAVAIVFKWADEGSWQPASKADVTRALADWFAEQDIHPSSNSIKPYARWLFEEFQQRSGEANNRAA